MRTTDSELATVIREHWNGRAATFDDQAGHGLVSEEQRRAWLDLLSRLAGPAAISVLDIGCGTGFLALRFAELGHTVNGIDLSPRMIERARRKAEHSGHAIDFRVGDAAALEFDDETYDLVVARHVIWMLPHPQQGVAEWLRVLRPEGRLLLIEGTWADNSARARAGTRPLARAVDAVASVVARRAGEGRYRQRSLDLRYRRVEAQLPFSGGPSSSRLASFLEANAVRDVVVEPLMDRTLWGEDTPFPRYLVSGTRARDAAAS
jgi:ubiquinone/menaquinone biosynthesis C-methylase UbiE